MRKPSIWIFNLNLTVCLSVRTDDGGDAGRCSSINSIIDRNKLVDCLTLYNYQATYNLRSLHYVGKQKDMRGAPYKETIDNKTSHHRYGTMKKSPCHGLSITQRAFCNSLSDDRRPYNRWFDKTFGNWVIHHCQERMMPLSYCQ
jgi:hypothetical protein